MFLNVFFFLLDFVKSSFKILKINFFGNKIFFKIEIVYFFYGGFW